MQCVTPFRTYPLDSNLVSATRGCARSKALSAINFHGMNRESSVIAHKIRAIGLAEC
jgi:hypothetical protein